MKKTRPGARKKGPQRKELSTARLDELIEEATVDAHDETEQTTGFSMILLRAARGQCTEPFESTLTARPTT